MEGSIGMVLDEVVVVVVTEELSSASGKPVEKIEPLSPADFVGEAKRLSGRICSKLLLQQKQKIRRRRWEKKQRKTIQRRAKGRTEYKQQYRAEILKILSK